MKVISTPADSTKIELLLHNGRTYQRLALRGRGQEIRRERRHYTAAQRIVRDTRQAAGEEWAEELLLPVPSEGNVRLTATLTYPYSLLARKQTETRVDWLSEMKKRPATWEWLP